MVKIVEGEKVAFPLPGCTDIVVRLCSAYRRLELAYTIDAKEDNVIVARVEGDRIPLGTYALEVRGKIFENDWRSNEYEQVAIVDRNADADTELGETDEGEDSVEMDTAVVVLPPDRELEALVKEAQAQNKAMSELSDTIKVSEEGRVKSEESRVQAEQARKESEERRGKSEELRAEAETARAIAESERTANEDGRASTENARAEAEKNRNAAEDTRTRTEIEREVNELTRKSNEAKRQDNETARQDNEAKRKETEQKRENDTTSAISTMQTKTDEAVKTMQTKTDTATASMDEHRTAFDDAEATRVSNEQARVAAETARAEAESKRATQEQARRTAEEKREKAEELRVKNEESRQTNEQARITAETKRESDMAQAVEKANTASDIAVSANEPFVWMPFADLEHWNITAMDLTTGTVTLDTEEHGLAVGDSVTIAVNICDYSGPYSSSKPNGRGVSWDTAMGTDRLKNFPVKKFSSIPEMQVTAVNGAEITIDALKTDKNYTPTPKDWQLQRLPETSESRSVEIPERYKGKAVTITVEGQYTNRRNTWSNYGVRTLVCDDKGNAIFDGMGDDQCGLPFVKQIWSGRSGHQEFVDIGTTFYNEGLTAGGDHKVSCFVDKPGDWDITLGKYLVMPWRLTHYATRVTVTPYHSLLGGGNSNPKKMEQLSALIDRQKAAFGVGLVDNNEYTVPESDMQTTNFNVVKNNVSTVMMDLRCAFPAQDDLYVVLGGQSEFVFGQKGGRMVMTSKAGFNTANVLTDLEDMGAAADGEYHKYRLYVDANEGKATLDVDGVRVKEMDYVTGQTLTNKGSGYGCMGFLGQSIRWDMSYRPPVGTKLKGLQTIVSADKDGDSLLVSFAPCVGANWLAYFDTTWYPQMNGANYCSFKAWPSLTNGYDVQKATHVPWFGALLTRGKKAWIGCSDDTWAQVAP